MRTVAAISIVFFSACPLGGQIRFASPLVLRDVPQPVSVAAAELNGDGKLDLVSASGSGRIDILLQDPVDRTVWERLASISAGLGAYMIRAVDLDGDGHDDIIAADPGTVAYVIRNDQGNLSKAEPLREARKPRWVAAGDWNGDGRVDLAFASFDLDTVSIFSGDGRGGLALDREVLLNDDPHAIESMDHDGDGDLDLIVGHGTGGFRHLDGNGDGTFLVGSHPAGTGLSPCGRFVFTGDFNRDDKGDLVLSCTVSLADGSHRNALVAGTSNGNGAYTEVLNLTTDGISVAAVADLTGDGIQDLALVSEGSRVLSIRPGKGDGSFLSEVLFGPTGEAPSSLLSRDLDGDGFQDVVSADAGSQTLSVFWGQGTPRFLVGGNLIPKATGTASAVADLDGDGALDFFFSRSTPPGVDVFLKPGLEPPSVPSLDIRIASVLSHLTVLDLNGDRAPDLAGVNLPGSTLEVALLDARGGVLRERSTPIGGFPGGLKAGRLDAGDVVDFAVLRIASSDIGIFLNQGEGAFSQASPVPTLDGARRLALGDGDSDGLTDIAVATNGILAIHQGTGDGAFAEHRIVFRDDSGRVYSGLEFGDITGDSIQDLVAIAPGALEVIVIPGNTRRELEEPIRIKLSSAPRSLFLVDLDRDGLLDITAACAEGTISMILNRGLDGLAPPLDWGGTLPPALDHMVSDINRDGVPDLVLFAAGTTYLFDGLPPGAPQPHLFRRGDADENGTTEITDAVALLRHLFQGAEAPCEDASDADDDGSLGLTDAVVVLRWLFQGEPPPVAPGPLACGEDPTADGLRGCSGECR